MKRGWVIFAVGYALIGLDRPNRCATGEEPPAESLPPAARQTTQSDDIVPLDRRPTSRPIAQITTDVRPPAGDLPPEVSPDQSTVGHPDGVRHFQETLYFWQASNLEHRPLRFEQAYVERYGYHYGLLQPVVSGVEFFGDVALLPIKASVVGPRRSIYTLGTARPGSSGAAYPLR